MHSFGFSYYVSTPGGECGCAGDSGFKLVFQCLMLHSVFCKVFAFFVHSESVLSVLPAGETSHTESQSQFQRENTSGLHSPTTALCQQTMKLHSNTTLQKHKKF